MVNDKAWPKISIVTPSYNQGRFLEETIMSVIGSCYPNFEYIIVDGGSTDDSVEIINKYEKHLAYWVSEKDNGQSCAINKGFRKATGDILAWLNSDDMYLPGALHYAALNIDIAKPEYLFGNCFHFKENEAYSYGSDVKGSSESSDLLLRDYTIQPSSFWTKEAWRMTGELDTGLHYSMDWDWVIRAKKAGVSFNPCNKYLAVYRIHGDHKTSVGGDKRQKELSGVYRKHLGPKYEKAFIDICRLRSNMTSSVRLIRRLRLTRYEIGILRLLFYNVIGKLGKNEILDLLQMSKLPNSST